MGTISDTWSWLTTAANWWGPAGILHRIEEHLQYSALALVIALVLALPVGLVIGHTGRGEPIAFGVAGVWRAVPTLGLLVLLFADAPFRLWPVIVVLVVLAVPPVLANTVAGVGGTDAAARDAAKGVGMTPRQVLGRVEVPLALPLILAGVRSAALQVIATATIAAYVGLGGLGRFIIDGYSVRDYGRVFGGAVIVAALALLSEGAFALLQRAVTPGVERRQRPSTVPTTVPQPQLGGT